MSRHPIFSRWRTFIALASLLYGAAAVADSPLITRSFSGIWEQPDQDLQGLVLQISADEEEDKQGVAYWFTYGEDLLSSWYLGVGPVEDDRIVMDLYETSGVEFMGEGAEGSANLAIIGTLTLEFRNCNQGTATYETETALGSGEFRIRRLASIYNMRCSGGPSDDVPGDRKPRMLEAWLLPAREDVSGKGKAKYWERPDRVDFKVEVEDLPDGPYTLGVCAGAEEGSYENSFDFDVIGGEGEIAFRDPLEEDDDDDGDDEEYGKLPLDFDPRDCLIEVLDGNGPALSTGDAVLGEKQPGPPPFAGDDDDDATGTEEFEIDLSSTGEVAGSAEASYEIEDDGDEFKVRLDDTPVGFYLLKVGGVERGTIEVEEKGNSTRGRIHFSEDGEGQSGPLDFEVFGQLIEVFTTNGDGEADVLAFEGTIPAP